MENLSREDIILRIEKLRNRVNELSLGLKKYKDELDVRYKFAEELGIKKEENSSTQEIIDELESYVNKANEIKEKFNSKELDNEDEQVKILNNILYLDDVRFGSINELIEESKELSNKQYTNKIAQRANQLIRNEELRCMDEKITELSRKPSFIDKITGRDKLKRLLLENYSLRRNEVVNKKYIPEDRSILEIINITKNCGFKSEDIEEFISRISSKYKLDALVENSLVPLQKKNKIPFFSNKEYMQKLVIENNTMMERLEENRKKTKPFTEFTFSNEVLKNNILSLELFGYNNIINEVI